MVLPIVSVLDHGAVPDWDGKTGTDNHKAFQLALRAAADGRAALRVPAGKYYIAGSDAVLIPASPDDQELVIFGDGADRTLIKFGSTPDQTIGGFSVHAGNQLALEDITIEGRSAALTEQYGDGVKKTFLFSFPIQAPTALRVLVGDTLQVLGVDYVVDGIGKAKGGAVIFISAPPAHRRVVIDSTNVFHHVLAQTGNGTIIRARRCALRGATTPFKMEDGAYFLDLADCTFDVQGVRTDPHHGAFAVLAISATLGGGTVHCRTCVFTTGSHCLYINDGVSLLVDGCTFKQSGATGADFGVHIYGGGTTMPAYVIIRDSLFMSKVGHQILTSPKTRTVIANCIFLGQRGFGCIRPESGGVQLSGCRFAGTPQMQIDDFASAAAEVEAVNCRFEGTVFVANIRRGRPSSAVWRFTACTFRNDYDPDHTTAYCVLCDGTGDFEFVNCTFERGPQSKSSVDSHYTRMQGGRLVLRGCRVGGQRSIWITAETADVTVELWDNRFTSTDSSGLRIQPLGGSGTIAVRGGNNRFEGPSQGPYIFQPKNRVKGWLVPPQQQGQPIAADTTITIAPSDSFYHVSGCAKIATIAVRGDYHPEKIFHGPIRLITDSDPGFALSDSDNIRPRSLHLRRQHEVVTLIFDPEANNGSGFWYEV
jgi:hypothetical protein